MRTTSLVVAALAAWLTAAPASLPKAQSAVPLTVGLLGLVAAGTPRRA